jgi:hypothetical protein
MSETLYKFLLSELATIRIVCKNTGCHKVTEMPLEDLLQPSQAHFFLTCPFCKAGYDPKLTNVSRFHQLAVAMARVQELSALGLADVEFVLPAKPTP